MLFDEFKSEMMSWIICSEKYCITSAMPKENHKTLGAKNSGIKQQELSNTRGKTLEEKWGNTGKTNNDTLTDYYINKD